MLYSKSYKKELELIEKLGLQMKNKIFYFGLISILTIVGCSESEKDQGVVVPVEETQKSPQKRSKRKRSKSDDFPFANPKKVKSQELRQ